MSDLIKRADAIRELSGACSNWEDDAKVQEIVMAIPSAELVLQTPQTYGKSINPSNAEVVADYISRADAIEAVTDIQDGSGQRYYLAVSLVDKIRSLPSADAVSMEEHVKELNDLAVEWKAKFAKAEKITDEIYDETMAKVAKECEECKERLRNIRPSAEAVQEWIPCSERLPDNKTYVLTTIQVSGRQPHARSGFYHDGFFHNDNGDTWKATDREVRAWMPLPKPYREDGE